MKKLNDDVYDKMKTLVDTLNEANNAYYNEDKEIMSNYEYDKLYDELLKLEIENDYVLDNSPSKNVGFEAQSKLRKEEHEFPALSLDKTKDRNVLLNWLSDKEGVLSFKEDGLTVCLTYKNGKLVKALTRGNGIVGEDVLHNAKFFKGIPNEIDYDGKLVVRGEAMISYNDFDKINNELTSDGEETYKNPRNLASGSVRLLDSKKSKRRKIHVKIFELTYGTDLKLVSERFEFLQNLGFDVVEHVVVNKNNLLSKINDFENKIPYNKFPSDGLVITYNDVEYGKSLGMTGKFPKHSFAFKWKDDSEETEITDIIWQTSRTGLINPVAVFNPIELEGTTVKRATLVNVSNIENLGINIGCKVSVIKANKIIPQIVSVTKPNGVYTIPDKCPVCGGKAYINQVKDVKTLLCSNPDCAAKNIKKFVHFVGRECMNIQGLSEATLEKFIDYGYIKSYADFYNISQYKDEICNIDGFGEKSYLNLLEAIEKSRHVKLANFINSLGILGVGKDASKKISKYFNGCIDKFENAILDKFDFRTIDTIGDVISDSIHNYFNDKKNFNEYSELKRNLIFEEEKTNETNSELISGKTFVITGELNHFNNRGELVEKIESLGGKVSGSVSKKTNYLINNDKLSSSSKNKKANELGIEIISEDDFLKMI